MEVCCTASGEFVLRQNSDMCFSTKRLMETRGKSDVMWRVVTKSHLFTAHCSVPQFCSVWRTGLACEATCLPNNRFSPEPNTWSPFLIFILNHNLTSELHP